MRKLFYIANIRFPTERAHGIQVAHMCAAFARTQIHADKEDADVRRFPEVTLLVPDRKTIADDPFEYYGVERNFTIEKIPVPDIVRFGRVGFFIESLIFASRAAQYIRVYQRSRPRSSAALVYTREELPLLFLPRGRALYEAHQLRKSSFFKWLIRRARAVVAITHGLKTALVASGIPENRILVAHDGYDEKQFAERISPAEARRRLGLPQAAQIAMYIGGLEPWKGAETLYKAATLLAKDTIQVVLIGGTAEETQRLRSRYPEVLFLGTRPYRELSQNQQAADVLVIPNSAREEISRTFTSPLKLFAHMASGIPIVASRLPALLEILSDDTAYVVEPDDSRALASGILAALRNSAESEKKAKKAAADVTRYSWDKRAEHVITYIRQCQNTHESS